MKQRTKFRLGITLVLAAAFVSAALAQAAYAQDTTGATNQSNDQKVVFTWASTAEPDSVNPMTGYSAIEFYFWTSSYHLPIDFAADFSSERIASVSCG